MTEKYYKVIIEHEYIVKANNYQESIDAVKDQRNILYSDESSNAYELTKEDLNYYELIDR